MKRPVETKVITAAAGGGLSALVVADLILWGAGGTVWGGGLDSWSADQAIAAVPWPVANAVRGVVATVGAFAGGWIGRHTPRPDLPAHDVAARA